ncbi:MAG: ATP-dependent DNA helicase RecG [Oscillospiraceae bacterium]|nr:ATP-dependent DNA helicase RecG [Oscillospiraceae bacterium]
MSNDSLDIGIRYIKGVGETREKLMIKLGIRTLRDLVGYFPRAYEDRTVIKDIGSLIIGESVCVRAMAADTPRLSHIRKGLDLVKLRAVDEHGSLEITFYNQPFVKDAIKKGDTYIFYGKISGSLLRPEMSNPVFEKELSLTHTGRIIPIYPLTAGLSQKMLMNAVRSGLDKCADELPDVLPDNIVRQYELCRARYAYENIHFPADMKELDIARRRLIFEELFVLVTAMKLLREKRVDKTGRSLTIPDFDEFYAMFPFEPTGAQKRAITEASQDMASSRPMNRLIQGDVGSGKTLIAAACCWMTWRSDSQSAFMAPTEILARQHYNSLSGLLEPLGMRVGLLTGSMTAKGKRETYERLNLGEIDLIIGTHALISESVGFKDLALVITDEQHRFGVNQRSMLTEKGDSPHVLVMSATPIPRTLALIIYGDLDVSIVDEMPPGRQKIQTHVVDENYRKRVYDFIRKLVGEGRQVYVICPMVEEDDTFKSVKEYYETLSTKIFPDLRVELVHGKMPSKKKDAAMSAFADGEADILVATTVVEVGVDVHNAALIIIENADRFGLSQLHQLRGRVGRGEHESHCILFQTGVDVVKRTVPLTHKTDEPSPCLARLNVMKSTNDGFKIAEEDLRLRGPGDFFGSRQHGLPEMHIANFATDMLVLNQAQNAAENLLREDPELSSPKNRKLLEQIGRLFEINADKMN